MAWVPYREQSTYTYFAYADDPDVLNFYDDSTISFYSGGDSRTSSWDIMFNVPVQWRLTCAYFHSTLNKSGSMYHPASVWWSSPDGYLMEYNRAYPYPAANMPDDNPVTDFYPNEIEGIGNNLGYVGTQVTSDYMPSDIEFVFFLEVWVEEEPGPPPAPARGSRVYELDKGWSFDGAYIPHYLEMNWYFGDDPIHYHSIQKIRVHGMSKGIAQLTVATNGMQTDYERDFSEPQILDLPRNPKHISTELVPETNYTDSANRGLSIQMKFEGRNRDLTRPEPQHVLQVLSVQSSPAGTGFRSN